MRDTFISASAMGNYGIMKRNQNKKRKKEKGEKSWQEEEKEETPFSLKFIAKSAE